MKENKILTILLALLLVLSQANAQEVMMNHIIAAKEYMKTDSTALAKRELDSALRISPKDPMANTIMGDLMNNQGNYLRALLSYDKAIESNQTDPTLYIKRANLHIMLRNHRTYIVEDYDRAILLAPDSINYYVQKSEYLASINNPVSHDPEFDLAAQTISQAIAVDRKNPYLYYLRSNYYYNDGQNLAAIADIDKAVAMDKSRDEFLAFKGYIHFMIGDFRQAYGSYSVAIIRNPNNAGYYEFRGHANYNLGNYIRAYDDYSKGIDLLIGEIAKRESKIDVSDPLNKQLSVILLYRGMALVQEGRPFDACDDFKRAFQIGESKAKNYIRKYCN
ncbi:MAG: hypothetical protein ABFS32_10125 [Bacteroidota bacterium]